jgi:hypothetical protein
MRSDLPAAHGCRPAAALYPAAASGRIRAREAVDRAGGAGLDALQALLRPGLSAWLRSRVKAGCRAAKDTRRWFGAAI